MVLVVAMLSVVGCRVLSIVVANWYALDLWAYYYVSLEPKNLVNYLTLLAHLDLDPTRISPPIPLRVLPD